MLFRSEGGGGRRSADVEDWRHGSRAAGDRVADRGTGGGALAVENEPGAGENGGRGIKSKGVDRPSLL